MAGKTAYFEKLMLNRTLRRNTTTATAGGTTTTPNVTSSAIFAVGDIVKTVSDGTYHTITSIPNGTSITFAPASASTITSGNVEAWAYTPPALFVALFTTAPTDAYTSGSPTGTEVSAAGYARVAVTQADGTWAAPSGSPSATSNSGTITFGAPTANWGSIVAGGLIDTASGAGNLIYWNTLTTPKTVNNADPAPTFPAAAFGLTED